MMHTHGQPDMHTTATTILPGYACHAGRHLVLVMRTSGISYVMFDAELSYLGLRL